MLLLLGYAVIETLAQYSIGRASSVKRAGAMFNHALSLMGITFGHARCAAEG
jgi:hypothetical protein